MTATVLAPAPTYEPRTVSWRRLLWVAWVRYRTSLAATTALVAVVAVYVVIEGRQMRNAYAAVQACVPQSAADCRFASMTFHDTYGDVGFAGAMFVWLPAFIGAFAGAPVLARELETGTFRFAWTQGVSRTRWLTSLLVPGVLGVATVSAGLGALITWYKQPLVAGGILQRLHGSVFPSTGIAVVGWGLMAYALGVLSGLVVRRVVPALALTLALWTGVAFLASLVRPHYQPPVATSSLQLAQRDLPIEQWWSHGGVRVGEAQIDQVLRAIGVQSADGGGNFQAGPGSSSVDPVQYLLQHGYTQWTSYQPDSRYWTFQAIEFGWLVVLSLVLLTATLVLVRRQAA
jgi:hypothetical protein